MEKFHVSLAAVKRMIKSIFGYNTKDERELEEIKWIVTDFDYCLEGNPLISE